MDHTNQPASANSRPTSEEETLWAKLQHLVYEMLRQNDLKWDRLFLQMRDRAEKAESELSALRERLAQILEDILSIIRRPRIWDAKTGLTGPTSHAAELIQDVRSLWLRKESIVRFTPDVLRELFTYHPPRPDQIPRYEALRQGGLTLAALIVASTPPSAEQTLAIRHVQDAIMTANRAIALEPTPVDSSEPPITNLGEFRDADPGPEKTQ